MRTTSFLIGVATGAICMAGLAIKPPPRPYQVPDTGYNDRITLPAEAFGANWHIQRFRKGIWFPQNLERALQRAINAASGFDGAIVSVAPITYRLNAPITVPAAARNMTIQGTTGIRLDQP